MRSSAMKRNLILLWKKRDLPHWEWDGAFHYRKNKAGLQSTAGAGLVLGGSFTDLGAIHSWPRWRLPSPCEPAATLCLGTATGG